MTDTLTPIDLAATPEVGTFLDALRPHAERTLLFEYDGQRIRLGYHITEVKAASYHALDCGGNPESWTEAVLQLWDIDGSPDRPTLTAGKFLSIYDKAASQLPLDRLTPVVFECGTRNSAAGRYTASTVWLASGGELIVGLDALPASCKPQDRWQEAERARLGSAAAVCC